MKNSRRATRTDFARSALTADLPVEPVYKPRFVSEAQLCELVNLYHLARTALSGKDDSRYERKLWASREFHKANPTISESAAYKDLSNSLE